MTPSERVSSMVNAVRSQSHEQPSLRSCFRMMPPCSRVHAHACSKNWSLVRSVFLTPCSANLLTTLASVAIEAWSVPGTQHAFLPFMRAWRTRMSCMVLFSMCPMWSTPVTLGGGMTTV